MNLQEAANDLLADMLKDLYTSQQGRFSKATAIKAMKFVNMDEGIGNR